MQLTGIYPFVVSVWNFFAPSTNVKLNVTFRHHYCYFGDDGTFTATPLKDKQGNLMDGFGRAIDAGMALAFPMYFGDEALEISIDSQNTPNGDYQLSAGATAECSLEVPHPSNPGNYIYPPPIAGSNCDPNPNPTPDESFPTYYKGGTWKIDSTKAGWNLTIKKIIIDPQSDDVSIGPGTPG